MHCQPWGAKSDRNTFEGLIKNDTSKIEILSLFSSKRKLVRSR